MIFFLLFLSKPIPEFVQVENNNKGSHVESRYNPWDNNYLIGNLFDDNDDNYIHSQKYDPINDSNPFIVLVDMGEIINANKFIIYIHPNKKYQPKSLALYGGIDKDNLEVMAIEPTARIVDSNVHVSFATKSFRYYKLVVTDTYEIANRYISYKYAKFSLTNPVASTPLRTLIPNSNNTYYNKVITELVGTDQIQAGETNIKQISGCQFTNIHNTERNYYIRIVKETQFYNNIFENTELITSPQKAGIFWNTYVGQVTITNCKFLRISGRGGEGFIFTSNSGTKVQLTMEKCDFIDCGINNSKLQLISLYHKESTLRLLECKFMFSSPTLKCGVLDIRNNDCVFDHCEFVGCNEDTILLAKGAGASEQAQGTFQFTNNNVLNNHGLFVKTDRMITKPIINNNVFEFTTMSSRYFINLPTNQPLIELNNNTFKRITGTGSTEKSAGAIGVFLESSNSEFTLKYNDCKFYENTNNMNSYPNRCGGALQYGFSDSSNLNCHIEIIKCEFRSNKAGQHGGAVAIRTAKSVLIQNCKFETNFANNANSNSELLFDNHYDMKTNGFGGAIYLNPTFNLNGNDYQMSSIEISGCEFTDNQAYQANAIYIEGENSGTTISITGNTFNGNPNNGCLVCSEPTTINRDYIANNNKFNNNNGEIFYFVDPAGAKFIPKPTRFPDTVDTYIDKVFVGTASIGTDQVQAGENNIRQISGCRFTDVHPDRNYYLKINQEIAIFDNIFENTQMQAAGKAGIFWDAYSGSVTLSNCTFTRINGRGGEGYVFTSNGQTHTHVTMDRCEFIDCGQNGGNLQLISILSDQSSIKLLECKFTFSSTNHKCGVLEIRTNDAIFDRCEFTNCNENTILLANKAGANEQPQGTFQFTNNKVKNNQGLFIKTTRMNTKPVIDNNVFESTTVNGRYFINLQTNQKLIELNHNTFSHITSTGTTEKGVGGTGIFLESTISEFTIKYNNCKFLDNTNNLNSYPNCAGGAIQYGFSDKSNLNCHVQIINCEFKNNKAKKHGGAVAIRTAKTVLIQDCKFETNLANNANGNSQLLSSDKGFGGGVYLCPVFTANNNKYEASTINVQGCEFKDNQAYQGFAVYIEGDECDTSFVITENTFDGNSNTADSAVEGSAICSEVQTVSRRTILTMNTFVGHDDPENTLPSFNFVDAKGDPIPDSEQPPDIVIFNIHNSTSDGRHDIEEDTKQTVLIVIDISKFNGISYTGDGGAIRIINAGVECNKTEFRGCSSQNGGGGAIFLSNSYHYMNSMILEELKFIGNFAKYGGGLYVYSVSPVNLVSIKHCTFDGNKATAPNTEKKYGGSAAFITARNSTIMNNNFQNIHGNGPGDGGAFRIYNKFVKNTKSINSVENKNKGHILISNCQFEIGKDAKSCLFYDHGIDDPSIDLVDCEFTGNLTPGSHFIDGKSSSRGTINSQKLTIKGCKFNSNINDAINLDQNKKFIKIDLNDQIFTLEKGMKKKKIENWKLALFGAVPAAFALVVLLIVFIVKKNQNQDEQQENNENENANILI